MVALTYADTWSLTNRQVDAGHIAPPMGKRMRLLRNFPARLNGRQLSLKHFLRQPDLL